MTYSSVHIIYNPNSTGDSKSAAFELAKTLKKQLKDTPVECVATQHAGHAEILAKEIAEKESRPLLVSSSGDGGYNEVINGVCAAKNPKAICAVLPAGNANDHSRTMRKQPLADAIVAGKVVHIDLLEVAISRRGTKRSRYAHSYIGLGLTPVVAVELNRHTLNAFREASIVLRTFLKYRPFKIRHNGKVLRLDSLIFANINQMAKVLTLAPENRPADGEFEVVSFPAGHKITLIRRLAKAAATQLEDVPRRASYRFTVLKRMPMQLDGEVQIIKGSSEVSVTSAYRKLRTIL